MLTGQGSLGFNPLHAVRSAARGVEHGAVKASKGAYYLTKQSILIPTKFAVEITKAGTRLALRPVTSRVRTLVNRRANKIAWDKRKSRTPTPAEHAEAKAWTKARLNKQLPHGPLIAMLAGPLPMPSDLGSMGTNLGVAPAVVAALIPVFMALMNNLLSKFSRSGEAPVQIGPHGEIIQAGDPTAVPDAAADQGPPPGGGPDMPDTGETPPGAPDQVMAPGGPVKKGNIMLIGGLIVGAVVLSMVLKPSAKKK